MAKYISKAKGKAKKLSVKEEKDSNITTLMYTTVIALTFIFIFEFVIYPLFLSY